MQLYPLANFLGGKLGNLVRFWLIGSNLGKIWSKVIKICTNLIRFGQNQNLASPKTFDHLRLCCTLRIIMLFFCYWQTCLYRNSHKCRSPSAFAKCSFVSLFWFVACHQQFKFIFKVILASGNSEVQVRLPTYALVD